MSRGAIAANLCRAHGNDGACGVHTYLEGYADGAWRAVLQMRVDGIRALRWDWARRDSDGECECECSLGLGLVGASSWDWSPLDGSCELDMYWMTRER